MRNTWFLALLVLMATILSCWSQPLSTDSIYHLGGQWTDQRGQEVELKQLRGRVRVLAMIYTHCKGACPAIIHDMQVLEGKLSQDSRSKVSFVLVSMDPERDTPAKLLQFSRQKKLTEGRWQLLRGSLSHVQELAAVLDFKYRKIANSEFAHSNLITILDGEGEIVHQQAGLGVDPTQSLQAIEKLMH